MLKIEDIIVAASICIVYPTFMIRLINYIFPYPDYNVAQPCDEKCYSDLNIKQSAALFIIAMVGLVATLSLKSVEGGGARSSARLGLGIANLIVLMYAILISWSRYNEVVRLSLLGVGFIAVMVYALKFKR